jgi:hypothetical protein
MRRCLSQAWRDALLVAAGLKAAAVIGSSVRLRVLKISTALPVAAS